MLHYFQTNRNEHIQNELERKPNAVYQVHLQAILQYGVLHTKNQYAKCGKGLYVDFVEQPTLWNAMRRLWNSSKVE